MVYKDEAVDMDDKGMLPVQTPPSGDSDIAIAKL
jgi:hypothetical protein